MSLIRKYLGLKKLNFRNNVYRDFIQECFPNVNVGRKTVCADFEFLRLVYIFNDKNQ